MESTPWIILSIIILLLIGFLTMVWAKKSKTPPDYYAFFIMGIIWLVMGIPLKNYSLWSLGLIFTIVGLVNKSKWESNRRRWKDLTDPQKKFKIIAIIASGVLVLVGLVVFFLIRK